MKYDTQLSNSRAFRTLTGVSPDHFAEPLPYFHEANDEYFHNRKLDGKPNVGICPPRHRLPGLRMGLDDMPAHHEA